MGLSNEHSDTISKLCNSFYDPKGREFDKIKNNFIYGDCYVFAKSIQIVIPDAKLRIDTDDEHVMVELDGTIFDAVKEVEPGWGREFIDREDDTYCLNEYGYDAEYPRDSICKIQTWVEDFAFNHLSTASSLAIKARLKNYLDMCKTLKLDDSGW